MFFSVKYVVGVQRFPEAARRLASLLPPSVREDRSPGPRSRRPRVSRPRLSFANCRRTVCRLSLATWEAIRPPGESAYSLSDGLLAEALGPAQVLLKR